MKTLLFIKRRPAMKRTYISTILLLPVAALYFCVASASSAATLEVEPGSSLYYSDEGTGTPILFVPGWTMTSEVFVKQQAAFTNTHRVIVLDPRGQGRSSKNSSQYTYIQQGNDIDKLVQHLGVDKIVLVGWSYGCLATYAYVRNHGLGKISRYVGIDQSPYPLDIKGGASWNEGPLTDTRDSFNGLNYGRAEFTAAFAQWMVKRKLKPAELRWLTEMMESTPTGIAVQLAADALFSDYRPELEKLSQEIPTLHVLGEEDAATARPWLEENTPKAKVEVLGKHMMFWEDSQAFNKVFSDFLSRSKNEETRKKK
jgi:pimeloyl-ACP methyl ester carboxylesterase